MITYKVSSNLLNVIDTYFKDYKDQIIKAYDIETKLQLFSRIIFVGFVDNQAFGFITFNISKKKPHLVLVDWFIKDEFKRRQLTYQLYLMIQDKILKILQKVNQRCIYTVLNSQNLELIGFARRVGFDKMTDSQVQQLQNELGIKLHGIYMIKCFNIQQ